MSKHTSSSAKLEKLYEQLLERKLHFQETFPDHSTQYSEIISSIEKEPAFTLLDPPKETPISLVIDRVKEEVGQNKLTRMLEVTQEEIDSIFEKITRCMTTTASLSPDEFLYLEQQLSDLVGVSVTKELEGKKLPFQWGSVKALPHQKRFPSDTIEYHRAIHEAGLTSTRSTFGWLQPIGELTESETKAEEFSVVVPLLLTELSPDQLEETIRWIKDKKILLINPSMKKLAVVAVADVLLIEYPQYALGVSPEVGRSLEFWRPPSQGTGYFLWLDDPENVQPLGMIAYELQI